MSSDNDGRRNSADLRSFRRRKTRGFTARQQALLDNVLPRCKLDLSAWAGTDLANALFDHGPRELWLEIGFGGGEHLIWQAMQNPDVGLIGCEPFLDGTVKVLDAIDTHGLGNIRLYDEDARDVLRWLPSASLDRVFVLFPDPWPKKRHNKRRLLNAVTLALLAQAMRPGAVLRIGTDIGDYARTMLLAFRGQPGFTWCAQGPADWRMRPPDWPATRYEQKAYREGRNCYYFQFLRR